MNVIKPLTKITNYMVRQGETLAVAESVTAGQLQFTLSGAERATSFFQGGITVYNVGQKTRHLSIDPINGLSCNCVSERIAVEMATNICTLFCSDWGIGIVGYAATVPELKIDSLFAYYAFSYKGKVILSKRTESKKMNSKKVQEYYAMSLIRDLANCLWTNIR